MAAIAVERSISGVGVGGVNSSRASSSGGVLVPESQEDIILRVLEQVQLNMLKFQSQFNELNSKMIQLELVQKKFMQKGTGKSSSAETADATDEDDNEDQENANKSATAATELPSTISSQEIMRLDGRIDVLVKEFSLLKKDLKLEKNYDAKSSLLLETSWKGGLGLNNTSTVAVLGDYSEDEEENAMADNNDTVETVDPLSSLQTSMSETTAKTEDDEPAEDESSFAPGRLGDDEDDDDGDQDQDQDTEDMVIQPEVCLDDYDDQDDDDDNDEVVNNQERLVVMNDGDNSMDVDQDDDQGSDFMDAGSQYGAGSEDEQTQSAYFSHKGQRDNAIEYKIIKATGKHQCPLYPACTVECLSRRNLMRHYYNTHASTVTYQCPICGIGYARKDNLSKHYKKKHEDQYGPLQNAAAQARPRVEYQQQMQRRRQQLLQLQEGSSQQVQQQQRRPVGLGGGGVRMVAAGGGGGGVLRTRPGPIPRALTPSGLVRPHRCQLCGISYNWRKNLNHHMKVKHGVLLPPGTRGPASSPIKSTTITMSSLSASRSTNYVTCRLCPTSFRTTEELARHYSIRHRAMGRPPTVTIKTPSSNTNNANNNTNATASDGGSVNQCPICYKLFSNKEILKRHVTMHRITSTPITNTITVAQTSITPTTSNAAAAAAALEEQGVAGVPGPDGLVHEKQCSICYKEFTRREHVKRHMKLHSGHERYACIGCEKVYSRKDQLRQHQRQAHGQVLEEVEMDNGISGYSQ